MAVCFTDGVGRVDCVRAGVNVDEMPGRDFALRVQAGFRLDDCGRTKIGPGELFLARPPQ